MVNTKVVAAVLLFNLMVCIVVFFSAIPEYFTIGLFQGRKSKFGWILLFKYKFKHILGNYNMSSFHLNSRQKDESQNLLFKK